MHERFYPSWEPGLFMKGERFLGGSDLGAQAQDIGVDLCARPKDPAIT